MMTFNPAAAAAFSQAQLLAAAQQHLSSDSSDNGAPDPIMSNYFAGRLLTGNTQFPFNAVPNIEAMSSLMSAGIGAGALPVMSYPNMAMQRIQEYHTSLQNASAANNQASAAATAGGPFPGIMFDGGSIGYHPYAMDTTRRKNATRETTQPLKNWLTKHWKNPYPSKGEKLMLAVLTKMSLTQVSTWFANARRRLKKEKKWSPPNRRAEDGDDDDEVALDRPSSSNSNDSDDAKEETDLPMDGNDNRLKQLERNHSDGDDGAQPIRRPIWSIAETIHATPNIDKSESHKPLNCETEAKLKEVSADASSAAFNLAQNMLHLYPSGLSSQQLLEAYQRMMMPQAPAAFPQSICGFNPMLLAAFNKPGPAMTLSSDSATASSKPNGLSSVSPTSSTASQDPTKLTNSSSEDEKSSATPTSAVGTTTPLSTPQKSPSRSPTPSSTN